MKTVNVYTDGACRGNPGRGGYGVVLEYNGVEKELSAGYRRTTNNRMELMAAISGLEALKMPCNVTLYSDSKYLVDAISLGWVNGWRKRGWRKSDGKPALNADLWQRLLKQLEIHKTQLVWVRGHNGHSYNERCDTLATSAADGENLLEDTEYLKLESEGKQ